VGKGRLSRGSAELFVDTGGWFALADASNAAHEEVAREVRSRVASGARLVTTNLVVAETHALLVRRAHRHAGAAFLREVRRSPNLVVSSDPDLEARAERDWIQRFSDQDFSFTDAVSFALMADRGIREALALDRHFATAGFALVPAQR
jgi:uncharacterized protein